MPTDPSCQSIPYYVGCPKVHKEPMDMPLISSSVSNDMKCVSVWINRALNDMQLVSLTFHSDRHQHRTSLKDRAKKHAFWLTTQEMLSEMFWL